MKIKWSCHYNCYSTHLPWGVTLRVDWEHENYRISVNDVVIKYRAHSAEDGKKWALAAAERMAKDILACVSEEKS